MDSRIKRIYVPMTDGELVISAGTMYGTLSKMEKDGLIAFEREEEKESFIKLLNLEKKCCNLRLNG